MTDDSEPLGAEQMSDVSEQLRRDKQAIAESEAAARDTLTAVLPTLTALAQWARRHANNATEALLDDDTDANEWSSYAEFCRQRIEKWLPRVEAWVRTLRREVGPEADAEYHAQGDAERRAHGLATKIKTIEVLSYRGRSIRLWKRTAAGGGVEFGWNSEVDGKEYAEAFDLRKIAKQGVDGAIDGDPRLHGARGGT